MDAACDAEDGTLYYELNLQFHALILLLSNNRRAHQAYDDYVKELHLVRRKYFNAPGNMRRSNVEHRAIYEAIVGVEPHARARGGGTPRAGRPGAAAVELRGAAAGRADAVQARAALRPFASADCSSLAVST